MYWVTGFLGIVLGVAPFVLRYSDNTPALWTSIALGAVVLLASIAEAVDVSKAKWEYWIVGLAGLLAVIAPFIFGFNVVTMALWTTVIVGAIALIVAGYEVLFTEPMTT